MLYHYRTIALSFKDVILLIGGRSIVATSFSFHFSLSLAFRRLEEQRVFGLFVRVCVWLTWRLCLASLRRLLLGAKMMLN